MIRESFVRVFVAPGAFKATIRSYMAVTGGRCSMYFPFPGRGLELAAVSSPTASFLIIAGEAAALEPFRATQVTFHVDDLDAAVDLAVTAGATLLQPRPQTRLVHVALANFQQHTHDIPYHVL